MVKKPRKIPLKIQMEEALLRRLPLSHEKRPEIKTSLNKRWKGFNGELNLDYHLSFLPEEKYLLFYDLCLSNHHASFQIDALVATPYYLLLIESKNMHGTIFFDQHLGQFYRITDDQKKEGFPDPIAQAKRHKTQLQQWMDSRQIKPFPIHYLVAISSPSTIIETNASKHQLFKTVLRSEHITEKILELTEQHSHQEMLSPYYLRKLSQLFLENHSPHKPHIWDEYDISPRELLQGVQCPQCKQSPMSRTFASWLCPFCGAKSRTAHQQTIRDDLLLHHAITNQRCRNLLLIDSTPLTRRLLHSMNLPYHGPTKNRTYHMPPEGFELPIA